MIAPCFRPGIAICHSNLQTYTLNDGTLLSASFYCGSLFCILYPGHMKIAAKILLCHIISKIFFTYLTNINLHKYRCI